MQCPRNRNVIHRVYPATSLEGDTASRPLECFARRFVQPTLIKEGFTGLVD
jgi:hypothetical protein